MTPLDLVRISWLFFCICPLTGWDNGEGLSAFFLDSAKILQFLPTLVLGVLALATLRQVLRLVASNMVFALFVSWMAISVLWTTEFSRGAVDTVQLALAAVVSCRLVLFEEPGRFLRHLQIAFALSVALSLGVCLFSPSLCFTLGGVKPDSEHLALWRGIYTHKNSLGAMAAQAAACFFFGMIRSPLEFFAFLPFYLGAIALIIGSGSATSLVVTLAAMVVMVCSKVFQRDPRRWRSVVYGLAPSFLGLAVAVIFGFKFVVTALAKDVTLTGRTPLWARSLEMATKSPWTGFGISGFWPDVQAETRDLYPGYQIWRILQWKPPHAHNGFIEILLEWGAIGLFLFLIVLARNLSSAARVFEDSDSAVSQRIWMLPWLVSLIVQNLTESSFTVRGISWAVFVYLTLDLGSRHRRNPELTA